ncbi:hypothetical protein [Bradyrhizobium sp. BR 10289]|uniref:hypothetical protein n=1 Tax=Bradyrhizobium sp. BR 10289 TaxID=2749993 RepID=UPI001C647E1C|nr:hypothetical protein [Bradyrhizobium sp. BR 10289]MBW7974500.1 hypothetical protein [Bradyrhizobium sp. BR 10289]
MTYQPIEQAITACLLEMHTKLVEAEQIAKAACACAKAGRPTEAVQVSMDLDQLVYDAGRLHDASCLLLRLSEN